MESIAAAYIPTDRYYAMLENRELPSREYGSALFADVSGFTPLSEAYTHLLGARRGAEEISRQMNEIFEALIARVRSYGGSVIGFSGDAITCWFSANWPPQYRESTPARAVAAGIAMLQAMEAFSALVLPDGREFSIGIKVSVATGSASRFLVGDPSMLVIDLLGGETVKRMAIGEQQVSKGECIVDSATVQQLKNVLVVATQRRVTETGDEFALVVGLRRPVETVEWTAFPDRVVSADQVRQWMLPEIYARLQSGKGEFQAELRPAVSVFLRFVGIDFDAPEAGMQLNTFLRWVQAVLFHYRGTLMHVSVGDKGSYLLASFGVPAAHEDDMRRAANAATELRTPPPILNYISQVQIGISQGLVWVGAYGASTRRTYGVLGDEVNVGARLMQHASPGEVLATSQVQRATAGEFGWESLPLLSVKGKPNPISVARLVGKSAAREVAGFAGSLIGREALFAQLQEFVASLWENKFAGVAYIVGDAGMGKSRLLHQLHQSLQSTHRCLWMLCQGDEIFQDTFQPFRHYLRQYFDQSAEHSMQENLARFNDAVDRLLAELERMGQTQLASTLDTGRSFLAAMIDLYWAESLYSQVEPQQRLDSIVRSLTAFIQAESLRQPVILQTEDAHWFDSDSLAVVGSLTQNSSTYPIAIFITCRYQDDGTPWRIKLDENVRPAVYELAELSQDDVRDLAAQTLSGAVADPLAAFLCDKTGGNPFFAEQLVLDLRERGLLRYEAQTGWCLAQDSGIEVPNSVSTILIARLDRLAPPVRSVVQMASVLGQEFEQRVLLHMLLDEGDATGLITQAEVAAVWSPSREGHYHFRHSLLRDAAYDMQMSARKRELHLLAATALTALYENDDSSQATELAYHYEEAQYMSEAAQWYATAGDNARKIYALETVIEYYRKALASWKAAQVSEDSYRATRIHVLHSLGDTLRLRNRAAEAIDIYRSAYEDAVKLGDSTRESDVSMRLAAAYYDEGNFHAALEHATRAEKLMESHAVSQTFRLSLELKSLSLFRLGQLDAALEAGKRAVAVAVELGKDDQLAQSLSLLGLVLMTAGQNQLAAEHFEHAVNIAMDPLVVISVTNNLGVIAAALGDYSRAAIRYKEALELARQHNITEAEIVFRSNLGGAYVGRGYFEQGETELRQVIAATQVSGFGDLSETYRFLAEALLGQERLEEALAAAQRALALGREVGSPEFIATAWRVLGQIASRLSHSVLVPGESSSETHEYSAVACFSESVRLCDEIGLKGDRPRTLRAWAFHEFANGSRETGLLLWQQALDAFVAAGAIKEAERMKEVPT